MVNNERTQREKIHVETIDSKDEKQRAYLRGNNTNK